MQPFVGQAGRIRLSPLQQAVATARGGGQNNTVDANGNVVATIGVNNVNRTSDRIGDSTVGVPTSSESVRNNLGDAEKAQLEARAAAGDSDAAALLTALAAGGGVGLGATLYNAMKRRTPIDTGKAELPAVVDTVGRQMPETRLPSPQPVAAIAGPPQGMLPGRTVNQPVTVGGPRQVISGEVLAPNAPLPQMLLPAPKPKPKPRAKGINKPPAVLKVNPNQRTSRNLEDVAINQRALRSAKRIGR